MAKSVHDQPADAVTMESSTNPPADSSSESQQQQPQPPIAATTSDEKADGGSLYTTTKALSTVSNDGEEAHKSKISGWFHWHEPGTSPEEKRLIFKLDFFLLTYGCLSYFMKQLDQNNVSNAYASGMQEELGFGPGDELSWMNTYFNIGVLIGSSFANFGMDYVKPKVWLPSCLAIWSVFVLAMFKCNYAYQFYILRFFVGFFESAAWPGVQFVLGSWYRRSELSRRSALFVLSGVVGQMFSGYLQAALHSGMDGKGGMSAWRWLFIFDFVISIPVIFYGLVFIPDTPHTTTAFWLNDWERVRVRQRIEEEGRQPVGKLDLTVFRRIFTSWQVYAFAFAYCCWTLTIGSYVMSYFALYLKAEGFSVTDINNIPTAIGGVNLVTMVVTGFMSDKLGTRAPACLLIGCLMVFNYAVLTAWNVNHGLRMFCFIFNGVYGSFTPLLAGWVNESCGGDQQKRGFILGFMVAVGGAVVIPFQQLQFPSSQAPEFAQTHGWPSAMAFVIMLTLWTGFGITFVKKWATKRRGGEEDVRGMEDQVEV